jgi:hypothetical protein
MLNFIKPSIFFISILTLILQGCGGSDSATTYPTTLGDSASIGTTDAGAIMAPNTNTVKSITQEISSLLKADVSTFNNKILVAYEHETNYCDISGLIESQNSGNIEKISSIQNYENCQEEKSLRHGKIKIDYTQMSIEGKYPKNIYLLVEEDYSFNNMKLKNDLTVESSIIYNTNQSIKQITLKINGELTLDSINYGLQNITETITY